MATVAFVLRESNTTMRNATRKNVVMEEGKVDYLSQSSFVPTSYAHLTFPGLDNSTTTAQIGQILGVL